jgi:hypothetical protein
VKKNPNVNPGKRTVAAQGSTMREAFVPDWDKKAGHGPRARMVERTAMGQKKTPIGAGKLR